MAMSSQTLLISTVLLVISCTTHCQDKGIREHSHPAFLERRKERVEMVTRDIENYPYQPVKDPRVLQAMKNVPRHYFVPSSYLESAYRNTPLLLGHNQTISQPYIVASMTELLDIRPGQKVLEIGTGSGYQAAVLGELCNNVYSIEIIPPLGREAEIRLKQLGYNNIHIKIGDGYEGWPEFAPFDRIIVTCAPDDIPRPLIDQLAPGGRMVIPVGKAHQVQNLVVVTKDNKGKLTRTQHLPVRFVPMTGKAQD